MSTLRPDQIATLAAQAFARGGVVNPVQIGQAVACALAYSGGNTRKNTGTRWGLWGIAATDQATGKALLDPTANAAAMAALTDSGTRLDKLPEYGSGPYLLLLPAAEAAATVGITEKGAGVAAGAAAAPIDAAATEAGLAVKTAGWLSNRHNWVRVAWAVLGTAAVLGGAVLIVKDTPAGQAAKRAAKSAAKTGEVAALL